MNHGTLPFLLQPSRQLPEQGTEDKAKLSRAVRARVRKRQLSAHKALTGFCPVTGLPTWEPQSGLIQFPDGFSPNHLQCWDLATKRQ